MPNVIGRYAERASGGVPNGRSAERHECRKLNSTKCVVCVTLPTRQSSLEIVRTMYKLVMCPDVSFCRSCIFQRLVFFGPIIFRSCKCTAPGDRFNVCLVENTDLVLILRRVCERQDDILSNVCPARVADY